MKNNKIFSKMPPAITCFVDPKNPHKMTSIIRKLRNYFEVYIDSINLDPILIKAKFASSTHRFFSHDCGELIMYEYEIVDMIFPEFVVTTDKITKQEWKTFFNFMKKIFEEDQVDQMLIDQVKDLVQQVVPQKADKVETSIGVVQELPKAYSYDCEIDNGRNICFCQITKPFTDRPYTTVIRNFSEQGLKPLFTSLFIDSTWGFSHDVEFLVQLWSHLGLIYEFGELDLDKELKQRTESCYPKEGQVPEKEPEVYRMSIEELKEQFTKRNKRYREVMTDLNVKRKCLSE